MPQSQQRPTQAQTPPPSAAVASNPALSQLRAEIDALDAQILDLIEQRQALSARAAASKARGDLLKIRPDREAQVISGLQARADGVSPGLVERIWREILSDGLNRQSPFGLSVWFGDADPVAMVEGARARFGRGPTLSRHATANDALAQAARSCDVAVLSLDGDWWPALAETWPDLTPFAVFRHEDGRAFAAALARLEPGALGDAPVVSIAERGR